MATILPFPNHVRTSADSTALNPNTDKATSPFPAARTASVITKKFSGEISRRVRQLMTADGPMPAIAAVFVGPPNASITASTEVSIPLHSSRNVKMSSLHAMGIVTDCESGPNVPMARSIPDIAARLIATQRALGISPAELSRQAKIPPNQWTQFTDPKYKRRITLAAAYKLKDKFGITLEWIFDGDRGRLPYDVATKLDEAA